MCNETGTAGVCKDENAAVCDVMKLLCHDSSKKATLLTTCPKTCNWCDEVAALTTTTSE